MISLSKNVSFSVKEEIFSSNLIMLQSFSKSGVYQAFSRAEFNFCEELNILLNYSDFYLKINEK
jgi:hypothetical protein